MRIKWEDRVSNVEVLRRTGLKSVEAILATTQLWWFGHVVGTSNTRIPKQIHYGELGQGTCKVGVQKLRYKDVAKRHKKSKNIEVCSWELQATDRATRRSTLPEKQRGYPSKADSCVRAGTL